MRVALLTREFPPEVYGGAGVHVEHLAAALADLVGVEVHCFGAPRPSPLVAATYRPWEGLAGDAPHLAALRTMSVDLTMAAGVADADLVHSHTWYANLAGHLAKLLYAIPHVATTHSLEPLRPWKADQLGGGYALSRFCERVALEGADAVVAVSAGMRADVLRCYPAVDPERVVVIHNGVDPEAYRPVASGRALERHGLDPGRPAVLFVGRVTRQKGVQHLLAAARHLAGDAQLVLVAGEADTAELGARVRRMAEELAAARDGVVWVEEMVSRVELVELLSQATVFVCPSIYEPFGIVNLEAMACGTAVVASAVGGIPEVVVDGETGLLVPVELDGDGDVADPDRFARALAERIDRLVADPVLARRMGEAGRQRVLERFSWRAIAQETAALYERLLAR